MIQKILLMLAAACVASSCASPESAGPVEKARRIEAEKREAVIQAIRAKLQRRVSFDLCDTPVPEAIAFMQAMTKVSMVVAPVERELPPINLRVDDMRLENAWRWALRLAGLDYDFRPGPTGKYSMVVFEGPGRLTGGPSVRSRHSVEPGTRQRIAEALKTRVSCEFIDTPLAEVLAFFEEKTRAGFILLPEPNPYVDPHLVDMPVTMKLNDFPVHLLLLEPLMLWDMACGILDEKLVCASYERLEELGAELINLAEVRD